jgi:hypothetical protein
VKTRLAMIVLIGPRLLDPRAKIDFFLGLFRFSEEKEKVQEVLKTRTHVLTSSHYRQKELNSNLTPTGSGENSAPKPFIAIPGLAKARERVTKPIVKTRKIPTGDVNDQSKPPGKGTRLEKVPEAETSPLRNANTGKSTVDKVFDKRSESPIRSRGTPLAKVTENRTASPKSVGRLDRVTEVKTAPAESKPAVKTTPVAVELKSAMKSTPAEPQSAPAEVKTVPAESKPAPTELKSAMKNSSSELRTASVELKSAMKNSSAPSPILSNGVIQMGNVTYNIGPSKNKPATPSNGPKNGESIKRPPATPVQPPPTEVHTISDDSDSDDLSDGTATESKNVTPSKPTLSEINTAKKLSVDVSLTHTNSLSGMSVPASPVIKAPASPTANSSGKGGSSGSKVGRMFKAVFMMRQSPKGTPKDDAVTLIAPREEEKQEAASIQTKLQTDLAAAAAETTAATASDVAEKKHKNGTNGTVKQKKSVRMAVDTGSPTAQRNAVSMSSMQSLPPRSGSTSGSMSPDQKTAIDIYASTEQARSWRKSTRFVNVKSLANGFDRMKERGEKQQKRRSQTPDRRHFPKTEEKHEEDEDDDEEKDDSTEPAPEPWYVTDKLGPGRSKRQTGDPSSFSDIHRAGDGGPRRRSTNDSIAEKSQSVTGVFTQNGTTLVASHQTKDISYYQALPIEGPLETGADGKPLFRYQELVRRNVMRIYDGISHSEIESYLTDSEFEKNFGMGKVRTLRCMSAL